MPDNDAFLLGIVCGVGCTNPLRKGKHTARILDAFSNIRAQWRSQLTGANSRSPMQLMQAASSLSGREALCSIVCTAKGHQHPCSIHSKVGKTPLIGTHRWVGKWHCGLARSVLCLFVNVHSTAYLCSDAHGRLWPPVFGLRSMSASLASQVSHWLMTNCWRYIDYRGHGSLLSGSRVLSMSIACKGKTACLLITSASHT